MICHYWCFNHGFKFQDSICNSCHDLTLISVNIRNVTIAAGLDFIFLKGCHEHLSFHNLMLDELG